MAKRLIVAGLIGLLAGCSSNPKEKEGGFVRESKNARIVVPPIIPEELVYEWAGVVPFSEYEPVIDIDSIPVSDELFPYLEGGIDNFGRFPSRPFLGSFVALEKLVHQEAAKLGYTEDQLTTCSPKKLIEVTCEIIRARHNYFGKVYDLPSVQRDKEIARLKDVLVELADNYSIDLQFRRSIEFRLNALTKLERSIAVLTEVNSGLGDEEKKREEGRVHHIQKYLSEIAAEATFYAGYDLMSAEKLLREGRGIVCRQYATNLANSIFFVLKQNNPSARNTYVSSYSSGTHQWGQAVTLSRKGNIVRLQATFFDPTWFDSMGEIEGYNRAHFGDYATLFVQVYKVKSLLKR